MENLSTVLALIFGQLALSLLAVPVMHLDWGVLVCIYPQIVIFTYAESPWEELVTLGSTEGILAVPSGEVTSSVVSDVSWD
jgi:hypothetical protein